MSRARSRIAVIALGNPLLCDDSAALVAMERLRQIATGEEIDFIESYSSGMDLLLDLVGRDGVIVVDAVRTMECPPGTCLEFTLDDLDHTRQARLVDTHGMNLATVFETGHRFGYQMPRKVVVLGIEGRDFTSFHESPSEAVMAKMPQIVETLEKTIAGMGVLA